MKLSEKSWRDPKRDLMRLRKDTTRPVLTPEIRLNPSQNLYLYPFSDSFFTEFSEVGFPWRSPYRDERKSKVEHQSGRSAATIPGTTSHEEAATYTGTR
jgi:hypothetical protein